MFFNQILGLSLLLMAFAVTLKVGFDLVKAHSKSKIDYLTRQITNIDIEITYNPQMSSFRRDDLHLKRQRLEQQLIQAKEQELGRNLSK